MGLESKNLLFVFDRKKSVNDITDAIHFDEISYKDEQITFVRKGSDYWIDLLTFSDEIKELSIRIALCNPEQAFTRELRKLLGELFSLYQGSFLIDRDSKSRYYKLETVEWESIMKNYKERKAVFISIHGEEERPISADVLYPK